MKYRSLNKFSDLLAIVRVVYKSGVQTTLFAMPKTKQKNKDRHKNSATLTIRLKNSEIEAIDEIVKFSEFRSRNECVRYLLQPALVKFITAINTKSAWKASVAQISAEIDLNKRLKMARVNSNKNAQLEIPDIDIDVVHA